MTPTPEAIRHLAATIGIGALASSDPNRAVLKQAHDALRAYADLLAQRARETWQPIDSAPKDGTNILLFGVGPKSNNGIAVGQWDEDIYSLKQRGFWHTDQTRLWGVADARNNPPTHWRPLPDPPAKDLL